MNLFNDHLNLSNNIYDNAKILKSVELNKQQELVNRNPTAKYYQNIALNLHEQVQYLKRRLNEEKQLGVVHFGTVDNMSPEDRAEFDTPRRWVNPNHTGQRGVIDWIKFMDADISRRFLKYIRNNPRMFAAEVIGIVGGRHATLANRVALILASPELGQLAEQVFNLTGPQLASLVQAILNGTASSADLAKFNAFWNLVWDLSTSWVPPDSDWNLNAGSFGREGDAVHNSGDGTYRGQRGGNFYQPPLPR
jgi:hypothetical protein